MFTFRKLSGLAAVALMLGFAAVAVAADCRHLAHLQGTRYEPRASGRALCMTIGDQVTLSVAVEKINFHDVAFIVVDGELAGRMNLQEGRGALELTASTEAVAPITSASAVSVFSSDGTLLLHGKFREIR